MTMDFSRLHTYTPPQCAPENTGYTYSLSSSYSSAALEFEKEHHIAPVFDSPRMSRRSLRLQTTTGHYGNDSLADFSQNYGVSYSSGGSGRREARTVRSRKQQSVSSSQSLAETPRKTLSFSTTHTPTSGEQQSCAASDASLLSSILDQSSLRQHTTTTTDGYWGSNQDTDLRGRSLRADRSFSKVNGDVNTSVYHQTHATTGVNGNMCKDCSIHSERKEALTTYSSSSKFSSSSSSQSAATAAALSSSSSASIHCRDTSLKNKTGVLVSFSHTCIHHSRRALASIVSLVTLLFQNALWLGSRAKSHQGKGLLTSLSESVRRAVSSSVSCLWLFKQNALHRVMGYRANGYEGKAHSSYCGSMNVRDLVTGDGHLNMNGSLCDDCKGKQHSETHTAVHTQSSRARRLAGALWSILAFAGYCLLQPGYCVVRAGRALGSVVGAVAQRLQTVLWLILAAPGKAVRGLLWYAASGWYQLVSLMSLLNVFILTRCLPKLLKLLLFLLPFLLLLGLWLWGPSSFLCFLPAINLTESWRSVSPITLLSTLAPTAAPAPATPVEPTPAPPVLQTQPPLPPVVVPVVDTESLERLERMERRLAVLWERVQQGDQRQEQRHGDTLAVYHSLTQQLDTQTDRDSLGLWVSGLLENRLSLLRGELEQGNAHRTQSEEQQKKQQQSQEARLAEVEVLLLALAAKTEEVQQKQQEKEKAPPAPAPAPAPAPVSAGVDQEAHDALLAEVQRLEAELGRIRQDLQGVMGCKGKCEQLDTLHETVSAQVRRELRAVFYGGAEAGEDQGGEVPEALLTWLSERYVSGADLQASLASLELSILRNVSLQLELEQIRAQAAAEAQAEAAAQRLATFTQSVTHSVQTTAVAQGLTEEQVQLIVQNALKLYSQDRTGLVDYALESGGGSILSTRCSETYETKTALMSLFGLPLWYFSQSPRVVIQPDVYPGNCWAFKGSQGYLVIRLSLSILPTAFCLEHIPKALSPTGTISSAPRNFTVFGLEDEYQEGGTLLGHYTYQEDGDSLQTFPVMEKNDKAFQIIEVRVLTNWGHPEYTCLYRFRVHGEPRIQ